MVNTGTKSLRGFLNFEIGRHLVRPRWLTVIPVMLFVGWIGVGVATARSQTYNVAINSWDALFAVFGDGNIVFLVLTVMFLYLTGDTMAESGLSKGVLLRLRSRRQWWVGKVMLMVLLTVIYTMVSVCLIMGYTIVFLPLQFMWSEAAQQVPSQLFIATSALSLSPFLVFIELLLLLMLGWLTLGLLAMIATLLVDRNLVGFGVGIFVAFSGFLTFKLPLSRPLSYLTIDRHLLYWSHSFDNTMSQYPPLLLSIIYWVIWLCLFLVVGYRRSLKKEFL